MIPKKIHYCWFGRGEKPKKALMCIESWKKYCPDYEIIEWNEDNFDVNSNQYVKEAYNSKKYAFVTDYVRLYAMYNYGGIYMDTDVEVVRPLDEFLVHDAFSGFELPDCVPTGIMASVKQFKLFEEFLDYYNDKKFINEDGSLDTKTNVQTITEIVNKYGLIKDGSFQIIQGFTLYPSEYFCPFDNATGKLNKTKNTATIHWFSKSWVDSNFVYRTKITRIFHRLFGVNCFVWLKKILK
ncbi:glycosyl transferase [Clostridium perfringens]|uniref:glycosyltransferase family 32 protein n=1 Tax=Clostridium perfringens TaxID=1502 RepID=UPI0024BD44CD|nr:glycosyltransferase [Clostridium perfringens]EJT6142693.1 glycosyl transferase [Clostridium perfringens]ELC8364560.1 glycosyl transferase [Clostridium perfringens]ELC8365487.1 glycosyl transferase [Clostridium perfringens]